MAQVNDIGRRQQAHDDEPHVCHELDRGSLPVVGCHAGQGVADLTPAEIFLCLSNGVGPAISFLPVFSVVACP